MFDQEDSELGVAIGVAIGVIALVIALVVGLGIHTLRGFGAPVPAAATVMSEEIFVDVLEVGEPLLKVYFDVGQTALAPSAAEQISTIAVALAAAPQASALLSGYHDETGGAAVNAEVAKNRALSVRDALLAAGVAAERVLIRRPAVTLGGGDAAEARRVEVRVQ